MKCGCLPLLGRVAVAHHVDSVGTVGRVRAGRNIEIVESAAGPASRHVVHQVVAQHAAGIGQTVGIFAGGRIQQNAGGLECLRAQNDRLAADFLRFLRHTIDVSHAPRLVGAAVHVHMADHGIRNERAVAGFQRVLHRGERAAEVGERAAAAFAGPAIVAGSASVVGLGHDGGAPDGERPAKLRFHPLAQTHFAAGHLHGRKELPVRAAFRFSRPHRVMPT